MPRFCVNSFAQRVSGDQEVHDVASTFGCLPDPDHRVALGPFASCSQAVDAPRKFYRDVNGCASCAPYCHTT